MKINNFRGELTDNPAKKENWWTVSLHRNVGRIVKQDYSQYRQARMWAAMLSRNNSQTCSMVSLVLSTTKLHANKYCYQWCCRINCSIMHCVEATQLPCIFFIISFGIFIVCVLLNLMRTAFSGERNPVISEPWVLVPAFVLDLTQVGLASVAYSGGLWMCLLFRYRPGTSLGIDFHSFSTAPSPRHSLMHICTTELIDSSNEIATRKNR